METQRGTMTMADGRSVEVLTAGPPEGLPLILHDGTPGGLVAFEPMVEAAALRGLRSVLHSRPGYGASTPRPGRRVADDAADVATILDTLGAETFVTVGWSGGGPHALASAVLLPGRCLAAATLAGVAPHDAEGLDWLAGMGPENVAEFGATERGAEALADYLSVQASALAQVTGAEISAALGELVSGPDKAALTGDFADYLAASMRAAVSNGIAGWRDDDLAFAAGWGFPLDPQVPVAIWQGDQDRMVPFAHGKWLARHVTGARQHLLKGEGHLSLTVKSFGQVLDDLLALAGIAPA
jgi:pimeloyl-ACP methyl ester carboxylesterase